ncbi:zeta toxin family protein [Priestia megaterium]|uniref:zeta toxin family protein n=1 Tax=Priestia megaterium TaxID=1404 RepID=UPI0018908143|nr:zeta toxin family protein [Priestia megaterium]
MLNTKSKYCLDGVYEKDRRTLHEQIIAEILEGSLVGNTNPESFLVGGGSASGKGYATRLVIDAYKSEGTRVVHIDADAIKEKLPEYKEYISSVDREVVKQAAMVVHDESSDITDELLDICIKENRHFIFDGTMKNEEKYTRIISKLRKKAYRIRAFVVDIPMEVALKRAEQRFDDTDRFVPEHIIRESHKKIASTFLSIKDRVDGYALYDNTSDGNEAEQFAFKISPEEEEQVIDRERLKQFYAKSNIDIETVEKIQAKENLVDL